MFRNYLLIALRHLRKNPLYTGLNVAGLALGIAACLLIALYVRDELSYDAFHEKADRVFRVSSHINFGGKDTWFAVSPDPMAFTMKREYAQIEEACRLRAVGSIVVEKDGEKLEEPDIVYADSTLFSVFTLPLVEGDARTALRDPRTLVLTESAARRYFGATTGVVGRSLKLGSNGNEWRVTGVLRELPAQSHFRYNFFLAMASREEAWQNFWPSHNFVTYFVLRPGVDAAQVERLFPEVIEKYTAPQIETLLSQKWTDMKASGALLEYKLINLRDIHLHSNLVAELGVNGDVRYVWIFAAVALFILAIACINFMNLATARAAGRARGVGLRKVLGSARRALIVQFLAESFLLTALAFVLALAIVLLVRPAFNHFTGKEIALSVFDGGLFAGLGLLIAFTALLAGSYPAFYLSGFRPAEVLKSKLAPMSGGRRAYLRSGLVVFQFCTSVALIISVLVVQKQLRFVQTTKLGYDKEQLVLVRNTRALDAALPAFKEELRRLPGVAGVTASEFYPVPSSRNETIFYPEGVTNAEQALTTQVWDVDFDYLNTLGLDMAQGRAFDAQLPTDTSSVIINEAAQKILGWSDPLGKRVTTMFDNEKLTAYTIVGVVRNFNFESLRQRITPLVMRIGREGSNTVAVRLAPGDPQPVLAALEGKYREFLPGRAFNYSFLDEDFGAMYRTEQRIGRILGGFAALAIVIACLGLFGLAAYTTERRTKEIGIRKVLGASVTNITTLLTRDFLRLVGLALVLALPLAWYGMHRWLQDFAYRTELDWWVFALAGAIALAIALLTVSFQSIRAALMNPVKSLRSE
jgi:putative ABC transport system permease protein